MQAAPLNGDIPAGNQHYPINHQQPDPPPESLSKQHLAPHNGQITKRTVLSSKPTCFKPNQTRQAQASRHTGTTLQQLANSAIPDEQTSTRSLALRNIPAAIKQWVRSHPGAFLC
ncbi:hypothetical protein Y1Q_0006132 [Alligator mississippiensis]|uniref:Uncharacterized protein n=1 Tax=Alligator mississippiensis TaxID=8496 RepID=A0A151N453_ALLMI|nr:hypothetical protein Y1Q_0006132 [Alligator mississippiensis]